MPAPTRLYRRTALNHMMELPVCNTTLPGMWRWRLEPLHRLVDDGEEPALGDHPLEVRILDHVANLGPDETVVHVDPNGANLEKRQNRFDELVTVEQMQSDVVAGSSRLAKSSSSDMVSNSSR